MRIDADTLRIVSRGVNETEPSSFATHSPLAQVDAATEALRSWFSSKLGLKIQCRVFLSDFMQILMKL
jgi:hypothetical protein